MKGKPRSMVCGMYTFYGVYDNFKDEIKEYTKRGWNAETTKQYDGIVLNHIIPYLQNHDQKHIGLYSKEDFENAFERLCQRGKNGPGEPFEPWETDGIPEKVNYLMRTVIRIASNNFLCQDLFADDITGRTEGAGNRSGQRHARMKKSLTVKQEISCSNYLVAKFKTDGAVAGLMLMFALGCRNNDACGVNFGHIKEFTHYPGHYYVIFPQSTELGVNTVKILGKSKNSGRKVPLPKLLADMLYQLRSIRAERAWSCGYTGSIDNLPIACKQNFPWERCSADDLSFSAKDMFENIGMRSKNIVELAQDLMEEAQAAKDELEEAEFKEIESHPTAYILRRNYATHLMVLGLSYEEIRYVIGHKIESLYVLRNSFTNENLLFALKCRLDERPILNPLAMEQRITFKEDEPIHFHGSKKIVLKIPANKFEKITIDATAREPGDEISFRIINGNGDNQLGCEFLVMNKPLKIEKEQSIDGLQFYREQYLTRILEDT